MSERVGTRVRQRTFLALGDSYTIGEGVAPNGRWPAQLVVRLRALGVEMADPVIVARTGWTTDELGMGIDASGVASTFDLVSLLIGVNDAYRGRDAASYALALPALVRRAVGLAAGRPDRVLLVSIPDWSTTPFAEGRDRAAIAAAVAAFNALARGVAERERVRWADITPTSLERHADWLAADGLHPSALQYAAWTEVMAPVVHGMV